MRPAAQLKERVPDGGLQRALIRSKAHCQHTMAIVRGPMFHPCKMLGYGNLQDPTPMQLQLSSATAVNRHKRQHLHASTGRLTSRLMGNPMPFQRVPRKQRSANDVLTNSDSIKMRSRSKNKDKH